MFDVEFAHYAWLVVLLLSALTAWTTNFVALPGNWIIVGFAALFAWALPSSADQIGWHTVGVLAALAALGEVLEFSAGAAGAANQGASRRAVALALVGTVVGSIAGAIFGLPVPLIGPLLGALAGGAGGAYAGAYLGEMWKGNTPEHSASVGRGALIGRLLGTAGKLLVGVVMIGTLAVHGFS
jgi:hypothetical protein